MNQNTAHHIILSQFPRGKKGVKGPNLKGIRAYVLLINGGLCTKKNAHRMPIPLMATTIVLVQVYNPEDYSWVPVIIHPLFTFAHQKHFFWDPRLDMRISYKPPLQCHPMLLELQGRNPYNDWHSLSIGTCLFL